MNFYWLYLIIPLFLYFLRPIKDNKIFAFYFFVVCVLSYDNTTDFGIYYNEFQYYLNSMTSENMSEKGRELGWMAVMETFSFTQYGVVIIHTLIMICTSITFLLFSRKVGLLNISILIYYLLDLVTLHDNILRQNLSMIFGYIALFEVLKDDFKWNIKKSIKVLTLILAAFLFHFSSILLIPFIFLVKWLSQMRQNYVFVLPIVLVCATIMYSGYVEETLGIFFLLLSVSDGNYAEYYTDYLMNENAGGGGLFNVVMCVFSTTPLLYFTIFNKQKYETNKYLRLSVNLTWIIMTWKLLFVSVGILTRIVDFLVWFEVWGIGYMVVDMLKSKRLLALKRLTALFTIFLLSYNCYRHTSHYYGDNNYMTILSDECADMRLYTRRISLDDDLNFNRIR